MQVLGQDARVRKRLGQDRWLCLLELYLHTQGLDSQGAQDGGREREGSSRLMCGDLRRCTVWLVNQNG